MFSVLLFPPPRPFLLPLPAPPAPPPRTPPAARCKAEGWTCPPPPPAPGLLLPAPRGLTGETVVGSVHSACRRFNDSWLRGKETTSSSSSSTEVRDWLCFMSLVPGTTLCWGPLWSPAKPPL